MAGDNTASPISITSGFLARSSLLRVYTSSNVFPGERLSTALSKMPRMLCEAS